MTRCARSEGGLGSSLQVLLPPKIIPRICGRASMLLGTAAVLQPPQERGGNTQVRPLPGAGLQGRLAGGCKHLLKPQTPMPVPWERPFWQCPLGFPGKAPGRVLGRSSRPPRDDALGFYISAAESTAAPKPAPKAASPASKPGEDDSQGYG